MLTWTNDTIRTSVGTVLYANWEKRLAIIKKQHFGKLEHWIVLKDNTIQYAGDNPGEARQHYNRLVNRLNNPVAARSFYPTTDIWADA